MATKADLEKAAREDEKKQKIKRQFETLKKDITENLDMRDKYFYALEHMKMLEKSFENFQKYKKLKKEANKILKEKY